VTEPWQLFTPDFDYEKEPYDVREYEGSEVVRCYPNGGMLHAMDGSDRYFYACQCEVMFVGWDQFHAEVKPDGWAKWTPTRSEYQAVAKRRRKWERLQRGLQPGEWRMV
jgi:hypothetical protein